MSNKFSSAKFSIAECDVCGFRFKLKQLKELVIKTKKVNILACPSCWNPDHPQLQLGMYPIADPQAVRNPRPDRSYVTSGTLANGLPGEGSRDIQWGWAPVGGSQANAYDMTPNNLVARASVGAVSVTTT